MDILRRNTDYALRLLVHLAANGRDEALATKVLAKKEGVSYQLACKILQKLQKAGLVESSMGPRGGFCLSGPAEKITLSEVISTIQGPVHVNRCLLGDYNCPRHDTCTMQGKLAELQGQMDLFLGNTTLADLIE